jgi:type I restriction enzyme R subunit
MFIVSQSELEMEKQLFEQLVDSGYEPLTITNESQLVDNFRQQLGYCNRTILDNTPLSNDEFEQIKAQLRKGTIFDKSKRLRGRVLITRSNGEVINLELFNTKQWCKNHFQVVRQITNISKKSHSRYDVTILINGLPLTQIELKARGVDLKSGFDQIVRYRKTSYGENAGLFDYIQLFVISNGVNTRYFSNNDKLSYQFTFPWADIENNPINNIHDFADAFLEKCHLAKMIARYIVHHETRKSIMVLRPYQFYAVEAILSRVEIGIGDGYIWHTTGSGKTLTSFKVSKILSGMPNVDKVLFVVDRRDLDYQTAEEFNAFSKGSVDSTDNTQVLVDQLNDPGCKLIVTTIQKLNTAISHRRYQKAIAGLREKKVVFNFDECHRSQFGETHQRICDFFLQRQMFGFTGTPIFEENAVKTKYGAKTTEHLFGKPLHKYIITDAIKDRNVLRFAMETRKVQATFSDSGTESNNVKLHSDKHYLSSEKRIQAVVDDLVVIHNAKTHNRKYTAMMCVNSVDDLMTYYRLISESQVESSTPLRLATIFSCNGSDNEEFDGVSEQDTGAEINPSKLDKRGSERFEFLKSCVDDYNKAQQTSHDVKDTEGFYRYYQDISKRVRSRDVDILIVVNMFLTGFDSPTLNTLYVDKTLKNQGLIQAYSRTNRVFDVQKSHGNIVCYRDLKSETDDALAIFANRYSKANAGEVINDVIMAPYAELKKRFNEQVDALKSQVETPSDVDSLIKEDDKMTFLTSFRDIVRLQNTLKTFPDYDDDLNGNELAIGEQDLRDFESKYKDMVQDVQAAEKDERKRKSAERRAEIQELRKQGKMSEAEKKAEEHRLEMNAVLASMQFDVELLSSNEINVQYILNLIEKLDDEGDDGKFDSLRTMILDLLSRDSELRHKSELFKSFIDEEIKPNVSKIKQDQLDDIPERFRKFVEKKYLLAIKSVANSYDMDFDKLMLTITELRYKGRDLEPRELLLCLNKKPKPLDRLTLGKTIADELTSLLSTHTEKA